VIEHKCRIANSRILHFIPINEQKEGSLVNKGY
jgi:hypothetical protein